MLDYYEKQDKLVKVNGHQGIEQVHHALLDALIEYMRKKRGESSN